MNYKFNQKIKVRDKKKARYGEDVGCIGDLKWRVNYKTKLAYQLYY